VLIYFPLIVALGAGAVLNPSVAKICRWSGELSYPLYMVHYPFMWWYFSWTQKYKPSMPEMVTVMIAGIAIMIALAYAVHKYLDFPIRRYFKKFLPLYPKHSV
jgi:peptidoglycan/LPS O-acetylase OafA/YrhL